MAFDGNLAIRIRKSLARKKGVEEKKMFGGVGFLLNGNMLVGVWKDSPIVRLGLGAAAELPGILAEKLPFSLPDSARIRHLLDSTGDKTDNGKGGRKYLNDKSLRFFLGKSREGQKRPWVF